ncbi:peptidase dimerization domain-containing protein, partial [Arthrobacter sp. JCM 19049]|uniref:peptidase dimerization domain-containing protein n=1 Tax=Arthrobacter sp. JCM 19049 TaxID=1460643 RepID=UPI0024366217
RHRPPGAGGGTWNVGTLHAGHGTSIVPDTAELGVDRRLLPGEDPQQILEQLLRRLRLLIADIAIPHRELIQITGEVQMQMPGFLTEPGHPFTRRVCQALADAGASAETGIWTASCEGGFLAEHHQVPTLVLGPGGNQHPGPPAQRKRFHPGLVHRGAGLRTHRAAPSSPSVGLRRRQCPAQHSCRRSAGKRISRPKRRNWPASRWPGRRSATRSNGSTTASTDT